MARNTTIVISDEVSAVLRRATFEGFNLYLPSGLDGALYKEVDKVLRLAGACWDRRQPMGPSGIKGAHVLTSPEDAAKLGLAIERGQIIDTKKLHQQFFTPKRVAEELVDQVLDELQEPAAMGTITRMRFMEPSAGGGVIADTLVQWLTGGQSPDKLPDWATIVCVEIDPQLAKGLVAKGHKVLCADFLSIQPKASSLCDYIFMNPPFTAGQDMKHVLHAFGFLKPGGRLTAIMSAGAGLGTSRLHQEFQQLYQAYGVTLDELPEGTFAESGTQVRTVVYHFIHPDF